MDRGRTGHTEVFGPSRGHGGAPLLRECGDGASSWALTPTRRSPEQSSVATGLVAHMGQGNALPSCTGAWKKTSTDSTTPRNRPYKSSVTKPTNQGASTTSCFVASAPRTAKFSRPGTLPSATTRPSYSGPSAWRCWHAQIRRVGAPSSFLRLTSWTPNSTKG